MGKSILAIAIGASTGSLLRWWLGVKLNAIFTTLPLGTLTANLVGGYIIGFAVSFFVSAPGITQEWRLLIITGFCGGLTTFSTFSAEIVNLLQQGRLTWGLGGVAIHVMGSLIMTALGMFTFALAFSR